MVSGFENSVFFNCLTDLNLTITSVMKISKHKTDSVLVAPQDSQVKSVGRERIVQGTSEICRNPRDLIS